MPPVTLRAHHLLCLQGFRGLGYSPTFVEKMAALRRRLLAQHETAVVLTNQPDVICRACPHLDQHGACLRGAPETRDTALLDALAAESGTQDTWTAWLDRLASRLHGEAFERICASCSWLEWGYCRQALEALRSTRKGDHE